MIPQFELQSIDSLRRTLSSPKRILLIGHVAPDGDAVGSTQAFRMILEQLGHTVSVVYPTFFPSSFLCIRGASEALVAKRDFADAQRAIRESEVIICMDLNEPKRVDKLADDLLHSSAYKVLIDHHLHPAAFADLVFSFPEISSTCLLLYHLIQALGWDHFITRDCAEAIYLGMMTDTGGFSYNSEDPHIYTTLSALIEKGIRKDRLTSEITRSYTVDKVRLNAYAIMQNMKVFDRYHTTIITLSHKEKRTFHYQVGDTEGLVNVPLEAKDIVFSIFIYEVEDYCKISFRSKGSFPTNRFAKDFFNGGGHLNASGAEVHATLTETYDLVLKALEVMHPTQKDIPDEW